MRFRGEPNPILLGSGAEENINKTSAPIDDNNIKYTHIFRGNRKQFHFLIFLSATRYVYRIVALFHTVIYQGKDNKIGITDARH